MKKLNKLQINSDRLMKNKELSIIRGGYGWTYCIKNGNPCGNMPTGNCAGASVAFCDSVCPGWTSIVCFGN